MKTPEGIGHVGTLSQDDWDILRGINNGDNYSLHFNHQPKRLLLPKNSSISQIGEAQPIGRRDAKKVARALTQLIVPLKPYGDRLLVSAQHGSVAPNKLQRSNGDFHQEILWTTLASDNTALATEFLVDHNRQDRHNGLRALSADDLLHEYDGLTPEHIDSLGYDAIYDLGLDIWTPPANEIIIARNASHRAVTNSTGSEQDRSFARAVAL